MARDSTKGRSGQVEIRYFGHSSFLWTTTAGSRILIDPYGDPYDDSRPFPSYGTPGSSRWFLRPHPRTECDVLLITHPHFDHDAVERVEGAPTILRDPLEIKADDFRIRGFMGRHAGGFGKEFEQRNVAFIIEIAGITFCHLGDNRVELPKEMVDSVETVDVLLVTVDDNNHLLSYEAVEQLTSALNPSIVIPTHYLIPGLTDPASTLGGIENWLAEQPNIRLLGSDRANLSATALPEQQEIWVPEVA